MSARIPTGIALAALFAWLILLAPLWLFATALAGIILGALWEWTHLHHRIQQHQKTSQLQFIQSLLQGILILLIAAAALWWLRTAHGDTGAPLTLALLLVICSTDIFAYIIGRRFGKRKLAPRISPGKTIAGVVGGIGGAMLVALSITLASTTVLPHLAPTQSPKWLIACLAAVASSILGDLYESRIKRAAAVKDSGRLLPGHGGILDRIDGILAAVPVFTALWWLL